ncbi:MAG: hypothetical protein MI864_18980, partial [Pseudomonadales bacterium]|nr:hypothetical protein [Pseudomonadales bacterium]
MKRLYTVTPKILLALLLLTILLLLLIWLLTGRIALHYTNEFLTQQGASLNSDAEVVFNPFSSELQINNLVITRDDQERLHIEKFKLGYLFTDIFSNQIILDRASIHGLNLHMRISERETEIAGIRPPQGESSPPETADSPASETPPLMGWFIGLPRLTITDTNIEIELPEGTQKINTELLEIKDLELSDAELGAELRWLTAVNGAPVQLSLEVSGENPLSPDSAIIDATGYYELADINFKQYAPWMPETIKRLTGKLGLSGDFQFSMTPDSMNIKQQEGAVTLGD